MNRILTFPPNSTNGTLTCVDIPIIDDHRFEKKEYFYLHVKVEERNIHIYGHPYISIHIYDNDGTEN